MPVGIVHVSHLPNGLFEPQMYEYFKQFGAVDNVRVMRSKKSGRSKGHGFIQFRSDAVAKVVAETMHNYLMFEKILKCKFIPLGELGPTTFGNIGLQSKKKLRKHIFTKSQWPKIYAERLNRVKDETKLKRLRGQMLSRIAVKNAKLKALGINYTFQPPEHSDSVKMEVKEEVETTDAETEQPQPSSSSSGAAHGAVAGAGRVKRKRTRKELNESIVVVGTNEVKEEVPSDVESLTNAKEGRSSRRQRAAKTGELDAFKVPDVPAIKGALPLDDTDVTYLDSVKKEEPSDTESLKAAQQAAGSRKKLLKTDKKVTNNANFKTKKPKKKL